MVQLIGDAFVWRSGMAIDADGCPRAYHLDHDKGLDYLANAGRPGNWWGLVTNRFGLPVVQKDTDPYPGFCVSTTSLVDRRFPAENPLRYVDSEKVPYVTQTRDMRTLGSKLGDVGMVFYGANQCPVIVADVGPKPGEGSIALARELGIPSSPRNGGVHTSVVSYVLFKASALGWPREQQDIAVQSQSCFEKWGGLERLAQVLGA